MAARGQTPGRPPRGGAMHGIAIGRAAIVLALFILSAVVVAGLTPSAPSTGIAVAPTTTTPHHRSRISTPATTAPTTTTVPANVPLLVANGSSVSGVAGLVTGIFKRAGWSTLTAVNATSSSITSSTVFYAPGQQQAALQVAAALNLPASAVAALSSSVPVASTTGADVVVVIGADIAKQIASGTTTTTGASAQG